MLKYSRKVVSWLQELANQVDLAHRTNIRIILTYQCGIHVEVVWLLRDSGLGNRPSM